MTGAGFFAFWNSAVMSFFVGLFPFQWSLRLEQIKYGPRETASFGGRVVEGKVVEGAGRLWSGREDRRGFWSLPVNSGPPRTVHGSSSAMCTNRSFSIVVMVQGRLPVE